MRLVRLLPRTTLLVLAAVVAGAMAVGALLAAPLPGAQDVLLPDQGAAKARALIQQAIETMGGQAYLGVRDVYRTGRLAQFGSQGDLTGYTQFVDYVKFPDKNRTEYHKKRNIIMVYTQAEGWELDRGGITEAAPDSLERYRENLKKDLDHLFRYRLDEEGMIFRYEGLDLLDMKQVEWVEVVDRERFAVRIAFDLSTHLPIRVIYLTRDAATRRRVEEVEFLSNWHDVQGVMTPLQIARERNGRKVYQAFFREYKYNNGLADDFFTRAALELVWAKLNKGKKPKDGNN